MRHCHCHCLAAGIATILLLVGTAAAQDSKNQSPGKMSVPSGSIFRGGFSGSSLPGSLLSMPFGVSNGRPTTTAAPTPDNSKLVDVPQRLIPAAKPQPPSTTAASHADDDDDGCTGACAGHHHHHDEGASSDHDADHTPKGESAKNLTDNVPRGDAAALVKSIENSPKLRASTSDSYCMKCHPNGVPQSKSKDVAKSPDTRLAGEAGGERRGDFRLRSQLGLDQPAAVASPVQFGSGMPPDPRLHMPTDDAGTNDEGAAAEGDQDPVSAIKLISTAPARAAGSLRAQVKANPDDFHTARLLAIALLNAKHPQEAAEAMSKAYESDPLLSKEPIDLKGMGFSSSQSTTLIASAAAAARTSKTPQAWLLAATIYQAQGSKSQALAALEKSRAAGLNADVSDWFTAELKKKPERLAQAPLP